MEIMRRLGSLVTGMFFCWKIWLPGNGTIAKGDLETEISRKCLQAGEELTRQELGISGKSLSEGIFVSENVESLYHREVFITEKSLSLGSLYGKEISNSSKFLSVGKTLTAGSRDFFRRNISLRFWGWCIFNDRYHFCFIKSQPSKIWLPPLANSFPSYLELKSDIGQNPIISPATSPALSPLH